MIRKEIVCRRGLRQEDLLSPLLFMLVPDGMNKMLSNVVDQGVLRGLLVGPYSMVVNLQYVDNTLLFRNCDKV